MTQARNWTFTLFDYTEEDEKLLEGAVSSGKARFALAGRERCPTTNKKHLQGYIQFNNGIRLTTLKKFWPTAHFEEARGNYYDNDIYCKKEGDYFFFGKPKRASVKTFTKLRVDEVVQAGSLKAVMEERETLTYSELKLAEKVLDVYEKGRQDKPLIIWIYGKSGQGKSRTAVSFMEKRYGEDYYRNLASKWFNGYDRQKGLIMEEFRGNMDFSLFLGVLDRYQLRIETKGGMRQMVAETIIMTSFNPPWKMYPEINESIEQITRRIDYVIDIKFIKDYEPWNFESWEGILEVIRRETDCETEKHKVSVSVSQGNTDLGHKKEI